MTTAADRCKLAAMVDQSAAAPTSLSRAEVLRASPALFQTRMIDRLTRVHPAVPPAIFVPVIAALTVLAFLDMSAWEVVLGVVGGYAIWTLSEYWIHRTVFHFEPQEGFGARLHWIIHGVHHDHPNDPMRLVMPPIVSVPLAAAFCGVFIAVFGTPLAWAVTGGFFAGYLFYDMLHFALHHARPKSRVGKLLRELHMRHHFEDDERGFAVSAPWWDVVFGTYSTRTGRGTS
jgi:sterol desaturase/sphingolipid hydroxylase (fatty acid hydroxylase superfamily)